MAASVLPTLDRGRFPRVAAYLDSYEQGPGAATSNGVLALEETVIRAKVIERPFAVATIDDILPAEFYSRVLAAWKSLDLRPVDLPGTTYVGSRQGQQLVNWSASQSATERAGIWDTLSAEVRSPRFVRALFTQFADTVEANLGLDEFTRTGRPGFVMWANHDHGPNEALGAHLDASRKLLTVVLYLDLQGALTAESTRLWGTTIYEMEAGATKPVEFSLNASRDPAGVIEFRPNRAFVMPNINTALHGVAGGQAGVTRRSLMWGYWNSGPDR
jgi:hypothetical protein